MLSQHEFYKEIDENLFPKAQELEDECLKLFNKKFPPGRGQTGLTGSNEIDFTIGLLKSSINLLEAIKKHS